MVDKLLNGVRYGLSFFEKVLESVLAANGSESGIGYFGHGLHDILYSIVSSFRVNNSIVDTGVNVDSNVIFGENELTVQVNDSKESILINTWF